MSGSTKKNAGPVEPEIPILEWIAAAFGLLLTLATLGAIGWQALKGGGDQPPAIEATVERITPTAAGYAVEVKLRNRSPATAAAVAIEGELTRGGQEVATSSATIDYVPGESSRAAGLFFKEDPRRHKLEVRVLGYAKP